MLPTIQVKSNLSEVTLFWDLDTDPLVNSFNLYWSLGKNTASSVIGDDRVFAHFTLIKKFVPNSPTYGKKSTSVTFSRSSIGMGEEKSFYVAISSNSEGSPTESELGTPRFIPSLADQPSDAGAYNSSLISSENYSQKIGTTPVRVTFDTDVKVLELKSFNTQGYIFVDVTGLDAHPLTGMPLDPGQYYVVDRNISKDTGVSFVASQEDLDLRIIAHH